VAEVCRKYQISETLFYNWRDKFFEGGKKALVNGRDSGEEHALRTKISELERLIGKQAIQIEILKKIQA
jgi:transposase-like protein